MTRQDHHLCEMIALRLRMGARLTREERAQVIELERTEAYTRKLLREGMRSQDLTTPPPAA